MWFQFPPGTTNISIQQQHFQVEAEDDAGGQYFRAPDHFAHFILDLPGFKRAVPPEGAPEDLPRPEPRLAQSMEALTKQHEANQGRISDLERANSDLNDENADLKDEITELRNKVAEFEKKGGGASESKLAQASTAPRPVPPSTANSKPQEKK